MAKTIFRSTQFSLRHLVDNIARGDIALPDLQRPFVWANTKVRDLFDSMYRGFPVGYLLFWETGAEVGAKQIGIDLKDARVARWLIVDGQQRLTSLYSVLTGQAVLREDYSESRVRLAFRPKDGHFSVADASTDRNPEYLKDVTALWTDFRAISNAFFAEFEELREPLDEQTRRDWEDALDRVRDLQNYPFNVVELDSAVDEEQVAEVFVRINSEGVKLNQADFILTLMSVFWDDGRKELEAFSRSCKVPSFAGPSPFNWYISPSPDQLLRVTVAVAFDRAVLRHAYSILRGKDLDTGTLTPERRDLQFAALRAAQADVLNLTHWHEFLRALERAGYRSNKMISSENAVLYSYAMWLRGRVKHGVPVDQLREVIARWFFMAHLTARYSGSFESRAESDFQAIEDLAKAHGFVGALNKIVSDVLTSDFWSITLPNELATAASRSPALFSYFAALNVLDADALLSTGRVRERFDPAVIAKKGIERHHLFPKAYLEQVLGITDRRQVNQIANMALVEWNDNIAILDSAPAMYWPEQLKSKMYLGEEQLARQIRLHALPQGWTEMAFDEFLALRRKLMAAVVKEAFEAISSPGYAAVYPEARIELADDVDRTEPSFNVSIIDLLERGLLVAGEVLTPKRAGIESIAEVDESGSIVVDGVRHLTPSAAAMAASGTSSENGWRFWEVDRSGTLESLDDLRKIFRYEES